MRFAPLVPVVLMSFTAVAEKPAVDPSQFTLTVHVVYSSAALYGGSYQQELEVVLDGKPLRLAADASYQGVLLPADYKAMPSTADFNTGSRKSTAYDVYQAYTLLMPDGSARKYNVIGIGQPTRNP